MASIHKDIRAALESHLNNTANLPTIAYENVSFTPVVGTAFLKSQYVPTSTKPAVRGLNPQLRYQGIYSITVFAPEGAGPNEAEGYINNIIDSFAATTDITFTNGDGDTFKVSIDYSERQQGMIDSPWYFTPINIGWYIYN